ncbi:MAG: aminotransferase class IV [Bacteroidales bacterium]|nr:aminotransferase class IV [Bacteroidales bacterium]
MSHYLNINGEQIKADAPVLTHTNRAFCYADGVFETIRCLNSQPLFFDKHYQRLRNALYYLKIELPAEYTENYFGLQVYNLLQRNRIYKGARARLTVFRDDGGLYTPAKCSAGYLLSVEPLPGEKYELNQAGIHAGIFNGLKKPVNYLSQFKTCNALLFVMAGCWKKEQGLDDCFILNQAGAIIETLASNIFLVKNEKIITPSIESGCVDGTMRRNVIELLAQHNLPVIESGGFTETHLLAADEIFITNAIAGINWIGAYKDKRYFHFMSSKITQLLNLEVEKQLIKHR